jgi:hypothetical protein
VLWTSPQSFLNGGGAWTYLWTSPQSFLNGGGVGLWIFAVSLIIDRSGEDLYVNFVDQLFEPASS